MNPLIFPMPGNEAFAEALAGHLFGEVGGFETRKFPDEETYLRLLRDPSGRDVVIVCTLDRPDPKIAPLIFAADAARSLGATRVGLVAPYLSYLRQDRRFQLGEAISSASFARLLSASFDWLVTVDPHLHRYGSLDEIYALRSRVVPAAKRLSEWIAGNVKDPILIGPDSESEQWVSDVAKRAGAPSQVLQKERRGDLDVRISLPDAKLLHGRTPVLLDDIISSARTMIAAAHHLLSLGCPPPVCLATHGIIAADSLALLTKVAGQVVTTNTIPNPVSQIDISPDVALAISALLAEPAV